MQAPLVTKEILLPAGDIKTDSVMYREKSHLLIPESFTQNIFTIVGDEIQTRFFVSSDSIHNMAMIETFFSRIYGAVFKESDQPPVLPLRHTVLLKNSFLNRKIDEVYHPRFVRNLTDFPSIGRSRKCSYSVTLRSGRSFGPLLRRYNFAISMGFGSDTDLKGFSDFLKVELASLKNEAGWRMRISRRPVMRDRLLKRPFNLINFIRIPSELDRLA